MESGSPKGLDPVGMVKTAVVVPKSIKRLFIANRGEICRRIATSAKRLGVAVVAVTDREIPPAFLLGLVDQFVRVAEETTQVYLNGSIMVELAKQSHCDAVHPGFGFLSENAAFAQQVIDAGMIWVGPSPTSIEAMASKARARIIAVKNNFPCIEALEGFVVDDTGRAASEVKAFAKRVGYPLLIKAALGGGGKGMRLVKQDSEVEEALSRASSEALKSFADGSLVVERYLESPRHVEVQVLGDHQGRLVAIGDRDCSVQRRHQKVLEEAPAPCLTESTRRAIHQAAVVLAKAVNYYSAGTVELLVEGGAAPSPEALQKFYFLEMNTRLQVEHPVTEEVYGVDLVEWQLRIASGENLPAYFEDLPAKGHSIEARIYAEDVTQDFMPAPGPVYGLKPDVGPGIRWEIGLDTVDEVTSKFDPMVAKIVASGENRLAALDRLADALERTLMAARSTNVPLVIAAARDSLFRKGGVTTHYLKDHQKALASSIGEHRLAVQDFAAEVRAQWLAGAGTEGGGAAGLRQGTNSGVSLTQDIFAGGRDNQLTRVTNVSPAGRGFRFGSPEIHSAAIGPGTRVEMRHGYGWDAKAARERGFYLVLAQAADGTSLWVSVDGENFVWTTPKKQRVGGSSQLGVSGSEVIAPLPGKVVSVHVIAGQAVLEHERLFVMESMKMELEVKAAKAGTIEKVLVTAGQTIGQGVSLATWAQGIKTST